METRNIRQQHSSSCSILRKTAHQRQLHKKSIENHKHIIQISPLLSSASSMAFFISSKPKYPCSILNNINSSTSQYSSIKCQCLPSKHELEEASKDVKLVSKGSRLQIGSPIVVVEAPKMIKTAASVPCLRINAGLVKPGDVGRIVSRKPKDVWAIRLSIGTYLIDGKYFKAIELEE